MTVPAEFLRLASEFVSVKRHLYRTRAKERLPYGTLRNWHCIGTGHFSKVYKHADYPQYALKLSGRAGFGDSTNPPYDRQRGLDAWPVFAQCCAQNPHKHLPKILHFEQLSLGMCWAVMPVYMNSGEMPDEAREAVMDKVERWLKGRARAPRFMWPVVRMVRELGFSVDIHSGNIMVDDDGSWVLTDPFSFREYV